MAPLGLVGKEVGTLSTSLRLTSYEFDQMVQCGAFAHLQRKVELINGELREMNPAGPVHDDLIQYLLNWSSRVLPEGVSVTSQTGLDLRGLESRPEPDVMWIKSKRYRGRHPDASDCLLAIEVSDSSLHHDETLKASLYARAGIAEYWIVDCNAEQICVCRTPLNDRYQAQEANGLESAIAPLVAPDAMLSLVDLFRG